MKRSLFYYDLPQRYIAQTPLIQRDQSKLLVLNKDTGRMKHDRFFNISEYLNPGDILVANESKVTKCRLVGQKSSSGGRMECFILDQLKNNECFALLKPFKKIKPGEIVNIGENYFEVLEKNGYGKARVRFNIEIPQIMQKHGLVPLPPYIKNKDIGEARYQTVYARVPGSTAAPTAGFHLTPEILKNLKLKGIGFATLSLDIGLDTFRPIVEEEIEDHIIHSENYCLPSGEAKKIKKIKESGGRVIAVGTTTTRVLESVMKNKGQIVGSKGKTSLYIYPGFKFKAVDALITNFHLPCSTLLVMVSAFAGREKIMKAYTQAKENNYRFYSFGDCMLIS